jgi:mono/diheme cytochrome c family protein
MPAYGGMLKKEELQALAAFLSALPFDSAQDYRKR